MEKLQQGDYVKDLTKEQFYELVLLGKQKRFTWEASIIESKMFIPKSLIFLRGTILHTEKRKAKTELTFSEFKKRAINTFGK